MSASVIHRKVEYRLYPRALQACELSRHCDVAREVYNWGLEQRRTHYETTGKTLSFAAQCRALTQERKSHATWASVHTHVLQLALKRLDLAFAAFFRRVKAGQTPGFPRFKSKYRASGFGYKEHGNGWRMGAKAVRLTGIGRVKFRGQARFDVSSPKTAEIVCRAGKWYLSVTYELAAMPVRERRGDQISGLDWGVGTFATIANGDGTDRQIKNPRHLKRQLDRLAAAQQVVARRTKGSKHHWQAKRHVARIHARVANQRKDFLHQTTAELAATRRVIAVEKLSVKSMVETPREGEPKARQHGLNREILAASPAAFHQMLRYKAEEAGSTLIEVDPRTHKPSQTCSGGGLSRKKALSERSHVLPDGSVISRDLNAARNLLHIALGREPSLCSSPVLSDQRLSRNLAHGRYAA